MLGRLLVDAGLLEDAERVLVQAVWTDPSRAFALRELARVRAFRREWDAVERDLAAIAALDAEQHLIAAVRLSIWAGRPLADFSIGASSSPHVSSLVLIGRGALRSRALGADDLATIRRVRDAFAAHPPAHRLFRQIEIEFHAFAGDREAAVALILEGAEGGLEDLAWMERCPLLERFSRDPRLEPAVAAIRERAGAVRRAWDEW
jgi:serine/threonine-protein kinase